MGEEGGLDTKYTHVSPAVSRADHHMYGIGRVEEENLFVILPALLSCIALLCHTLLLARAGLHGALCLLLILLLTESMMLSRDWEAQNINLQHEQCPSPHFFSSSE